MSGDEEGRCRRQNRSPERARFYAVAAELSRLGLIASVTARNAKGADILVTDEACQRAFSVQVKSDRSRPSWLVGRKIPVSRSHILVLVYFPKKGEPEFYVVPSRVIERVQKDKDRKMPYVQRVDIAKYQDRWERAFQL